MDIADLRRDYHGRGLDRDDLDPDPVAQFQEWLSDACRTDMAEPNAMSLATAGADGRVTLRTVLLKYFGADGFVFFTNLASTKSRQIAENPRVALLFPWTALDRQVIVEGEAARIGTAEALRYFLTRPRGSQIGAWVSQQSSVISSRALLEMKFDQMRRKFAEGHVPLPDFWGGYRVQPARFEFWQGRPNRLHDRFQYLPAQTGGWTIERLAP